MKWIAARVSIDFSDCEYAADLISTVFYDLGLKGVVIEDPGVVPDEDWGENAKGPSEICAVVGYFPQTKSLKAKMGSLEKSLHVLEKNEGIHCRIEYNRVDEEDWAESWKQFFRAEKITNRITVKPTWQSYEALPKEIVVEIDPGMAFGTGTHPTTAMCIQLIERYVEKGNTFLDVGTGSGILMAAAAKIGAVRLMGVDNDEIASEIAARNLAVNQVPSENFHLKTGNLLDGIQEHFDVIAANIFLKEILALLDNIGKNLLNNGIFICSGIIEKNCESVLVKLRKQGLNILRILKKNEWVAIASRLQRSH